jgi:fumarate reductase flavoprotein subunit
MEMDLRFHGPSPEPPNRVARMHNAVPGAAAYIRTLQARLVRWGGTILTDTLVEEILRDETGVRGVAARVSGQRSEFWATRGVVLAAGDYASSPHLIARFKGERFGQIEGITRIQPEMDTGWRSRPGPNCSTWTSPTAPRFASSHTAPAATAP